MAEDTSVAQQLRQGRSVMVNTRGVSMRPLLWQGKTQVLISPAARPLQVGDMPLMFVRPGLSRLHRVIRIDGDIIYTRGDNCLVCEKTKTEDLLGVVTEIYRGKKQIPMEGLGYRLYRWIWLHSFPLRRVIYLVRNWILRIFQGVKRRVKNIL